MSKLLTSTALESSLPVEHYLSRLALEASVLENAVSAVKDIIPSISTKFSNILASFKAEDTPMNALARTAEVDLKEITPKFSYSSFASFDRLLVNTPEGFIGRYEPYMAALISVNRELYVLVDEVTTQLKSELSMFISSKDNKLSNKDRIAFYVAIGKRREDIEKHLGSFFSDKHVRSKTYMTDVVDSFEQFPDLNRKMSELANLNTDSQLKKVMRMVEETNSLLNIVIDDINNDEESKVSSASARNISEGAYEAAKCVELLGIYRFRVMQVMGSMVNLQEQLKKALKTTR